jgi:pyruvate/2-oxoglutarate dehydrogenase complex dihydrolipoamide acyltransferase (E2) component
VVGLRFQQGQTVPAGAVLGYLAEDPAWQPPQLPPAPAQAGTSAELPAGLRITQPALALARQLGLDLARLPVGPLVTEQAVRQAAGAAAAPALSPPKSAFDPTAILVYGGGGHGKTLVDLLRALGAYRMVGIIDDGLPPGQMIMGLEVLGGAVRSAVRPRRPWRPRRWRIGLGRAPGCSIAGPASCSAVIHPRLG